MRIYLNLASRPKARREDPLLVVGSVLAVGILVLILLVAVLIRDSGQIAIIQRSLQNLRAQRTQLRIQEQELRKRFLRPEAQAILRRTQFVNALIHRKSTSLVELTEFLKAAMPPRVRLSSISVRMEDTGSALQLTATAQKEIDLLTFLRQLENSPHFQDLTATTEISELPETPRGFVNVNLTLRYVGGNPGSSAR